MEVYQNPCGKRDTSRTWHIELRGTANRPIAYSHLNFFHYYSILWTAAVPIK
jgi:hypothetical protein